MELLARADALHDATAALQMAEMERAEVEITRRHERLAGGEIEPAAKSMQQLQRQRRSRNREMLEEENRALRQNVARSRAALVKARNVPPPSARTATGRRRGDRDELSAAEGAAAAIAVNEGGEGAGEQAELLALKSELHRARSQTAELREREAALRSMVAALPSNKGTDAGRGPKR